MTTDFEHDFDALLNHLKETLNLSELNKEHENICTIGYNDVFISLINQAGNLIFVSNFANLDNYENKDAIKNYALNANVLYNGSNGGSFAINNDGFISYAFQYPMQVLSNELFISILDSYINNIEDALSQFKKIENNEENKAESISKASIPQENWQRI